LLKEHQRVEAQQSKTEQPQAAIAPQQRQIEAISRDLRKESAQLEAGTPLQQIVLNNQ